MLQGFAHSLKHILQRADTGKDHGGVEDHGKELAEGDILQDAGQGDEQQGRACADVQVISKAGRDDHAGGHQGGDGIEDRGADSHMDDILFFAQVRTVNDHAAAGDGQGEEGLSHCPDPGHGVSQGFPLGCEHEPIALRRAGQESDPDCQHQENEEKYGHHDLIAFLNASGT